MNTCFSRVGALWLLLPALAAAAPGPGVFGPEFTYEGLCEASAAVALDADHFAVADDESNELLIFRRGTAAAVRPALALAGFLGTEPGKASDLEAAARVGDRIYWLSSHSRTSKGKEQPRRRRFFATRIVLGPMPGQAPALAVEGHAYERLLYDLLAAPLLRGLKLAKAAGRAPEERGGLNIEGLAAGAGGSLLIGFRNPLVKGKALLVPLLNPQALLNGTPGQFGEPHLLDLGGRGIRSIEALDTGFAIIAGPTADKGRFMLYTWTGRHADVPRQRRDLSPTGLKPEALFVIPGTKTLQLLSDDGDASVAGTRCDQLSRARQRFRSVTLDLR